MCEDCVTLCKVGPEASSHVQAVPGVRFPAEPNEDSVLAWIERCDSCEVYPNDEEAADALVEAGAIEGYGWMAPEGMTTEYAYALSAITPSECREPRPTIEGHDHNGNEIHAARMADAESGAYDPDAIFAAEDEAPDGADPHIDALRAEGLM